MKRYIPIILVVIMVLTVSVSAAVARNTVVAPAMNFSDGNVNCAVTVVANDLDDPITAEIRLYRGIFRIKKWEVEAVGILDFVESRSAAEGATYRLEADVTVGTRVFPTASIERTND